MVMLMITTHCYYYRYFLIIHIIIIILCLLLLGHGDGHAEGQCHRRELSSNVTARLSASVTDRADSMNTSLDLQEMRQA